MKRYLLSMLLASACLLAMSQVRNIDQLKSKLVSSEDSIRVNQLFNLSLNYIFFNPDSAETYAKEGLQLAQKIKYTLGEANCMMCLCLTLNSSGNYTDALRYGLKANKLVAEMQDTFLLVWSNIQIMNCYISLEDYEQALVYGHNAKRLFRFAQPDSNQFSVGLGVLGSVYEKKNQVDSALYYEQKAFLFDTGWASLFGNIGNAYLKKGNTDLALAYYKRGINVAAKEQNMIGFVDLYNAMSKVFEILGHTDSSIYYANKAMQLVSMLPNPAGLLNAATQLAHLYQGLKVPDSTIKYLEIANNLKDSLYSRKKTREAQSFAFNEQLHQQELLMQHQDDENKIRMAALIAAGLTFLIIAFFLWRNNQHKKKTNAILHQKNKEIEDTLQELKSTQAQLIQSEKMASLGELTAGIAHEIQNPLNFVNNFSDINTELVEEATLEIDKGKLTEAKVLLLDIKDNQEKINHHGRRAEAIVKGMLLHSRTSSGTKELTDINKQADEFLRLSYHGFRAKDKSFNAVIKSDYDQSVGSVHVVPQDIGRVLLNLFNNAFYAVNEKKVRQPDGYEPVVSVRTQRKSDKVKISVKDNGDGIPQKVVDKIFQPFFTTKPSGQGTGLGLSLAYDIIKAHGGEIKVETKESEGTEFIIILQATNNLDQSPRNETN